MNENINLCKILKGHEGETFYSPILGNLTFECIIYPYVRFKVIDSNDNWDINSNGKLYNDSDELIVFPFKDQRDWNKWIEEQEPKVPKTWSELVKQNKCESYILGKGFGEVDFTSKGRTSIEKSALALLKIHQLIEHGYGGNVTKVEWTDREITKYFISFDNDGDFGIEKTILSEEFSHIAFHTGKQAKEFLKYPENVQLLKDYFIL